MLHGEKVPYEIENSVKGREFVCGFADLEYGSGVWVSSFRSCVTSKDYVCKQLKKTVMFLDQQLSFPYNCQKMNGQIYVLLC